MLVIMKRKATATNLEQVKQFLVKKDCDFHQSTGVDRIILGVVGDTSNINCEALRQIPGVLDIYPIPDEE
jgi:3-deoxy-7-phosphoheptulonate synthase